MKFLKSLQKAVLKYRRKSLAKEIFAKHKGVVQCGPFEGMHLNGVANISQAAHGLKIFGLYEEPVMKAMLEWCPTECLIDIGAGDGYYPVGMLKKNLVKRAICFEMSESGQVAIKTNAELNQVGGQVEILGAAGVDMADVLDQMKVPKEQTIILCDIEGAEFSLITKELIEKLSGAKFVIELHEPIADGDNAKLRADLLARFPDHYQTSILVDSPRSWSGIKELEEMHDLDRALVTCEGRKFIGEWLFAEPKTSGS
ncbi:hypothetical protein N9051_02420 [Akkermansiaceae bacterium]|nr:hypothetical protein [Akkermansiaceae bacterium]